MAVWLDISVRAFAAMLSKSDLVVIIQKLISSNSWEEARPLCNDLLRQEPNDIYALNTLIQIDLTQNNYNQVIFYCEKLLAIQPANLQLHQILARCLEQLSGSDPSGASLATVLEKLPAAYSSRLLYGRALELQGDMFGAGSQYLTAVKTAQAKGFWLNEASTAPWCRQYVAYALGFINKYKVNLGYQWLEPLWQRFGKTEMERVTKAIQMYTGERPLVLADPRQQPNYLYVPDLPLAPVFDRHVLSFAEQYESATASIQAELKQLQEQSKDFKPFQEGEEGKSLTAGGAWDAYFFYRHGKTYTEHLAQCPATAQALSQLPLVHISEHAPEVCFSIMQPHTHILPHRGATNSRAVLHLGLDIPDQCRLNLPGIAELSWQEGKIFAFDDTYLHEAWNKSDNTRAVILADIWNPYLREEEQIALTELIEQIGLLNQQTKAVLS
jgi:aspartate beta-hydroxylase